MTIDELRDSGLILFKAVVGSRAYGLATASSDTDIRGVFYLPLDYY
ncbi:MAG: DNA polymerase beta superfamily protein, partial [Sphingobacterium siyangense]